MLKLVVMSFVGCRLLEELESVDKDASGVQQSRVTHLTQ